MNSSTNLARPIHIQTFMLFWSNPFKTLYLTPDRLWRTLYLTPDRLWSAMCVYVCFL